MGREVKRVALDFSWPLEKVWSGFLNPHYAHSHNCPHCDGRGDSPVAKQLSDRWYGYTPFRPEDRGSTPFLPMHPVVRACAEHHVERSPEFYGRGEAAVAREAQRLADHFNKSWMHHLNQDDVTALIAAGRLVDFTHIFEPGTGWRKRENFVPPTAAEVNAWSLRGMGHDSINQWVVVKAECARLGVATSCSYCGGEGTLWESEDYKHLAEKWEPTEPPAGDGYQIWETVSEGSPISPVFATPEELARWMTGRAWGADDGLSYETWLSFIRGPGWAPSLVANATGVHSGVLASGRAD